LCVYRLNKEVLL